MVELIRTVGYIGLFAIIFAESGLLIGFFLPGDSLLFTAGFLASSAGESVLRELATKTNTPALSFSLPILLVGFFVCAVIGDNVGYAFGRRVGVRLFQREDNILFHKKNIVRAQAFYEKHGGKTIILARFIPVVRTFAPVVAGVGHMQYRMFLIFNLIGGALWALGVTLAGYFLGNWLIQTLHIQPDEIDKILLPIIVVILVISVLPVVLHFARDPEIRAAIRNRGKGAKPTESV